MEDAVFPANLGRTGRNRITSRLPTMRELMRSQRYCCVMAEETLAIRIP